MIKVFLSENLLKTVTDTNDEKNHICNLSQFHILVKVIQSYVFFQNCMKTTKKYIFWMKNTKHGKYYLFGQKTQKYGQNMHFLKKYAQYPQICIFTTFW